MVERLTVGQQTGGGRFCAVKPRTRLLYFALVSLAAIPLGCGEEDSPAGPGPAGTSPTITSVLPPGASPGIHVKILGSNFGGTQGNGGVRFGGKEAVIDSWGNTEINCVVPPGFSPGSGLDVTLTTSAGESSSWQIDITPPNTYMVTLPADMDMYPCWGPGDEWIYYCSTRDAGEWNIWRIPAIGGVPQQVTFDPTSDLFPSVNFSSGELAWSSERKFSGQNPEGDYEIFCGFPICTDPGTVCTTTMATSNESRDLYPAWARTVYAGVSMAYAWEQVDQNGHFVAWKIMLSTGVGPVELTEGLQPSFSGDGEWIVYSHDANIYKIRTDGGVPVQLTATGQDTRPHWGCGDDKIVFERFNDGNFPDIFIMNSDGTGAQPIVSTRGDEYWPRWSSDCSKVVYYALVSGRYNIYVYVVP
jgi:Tol biopolymer transport system component